MSRPRIGPAEAVMIASAVLAVVLGALAWRSAGPAGSVCLMGSTLFLGAAVVRIGQWFEDQRARHLRGKREAARQRQQHSREPLPRRWDVPDYPPEDLRPPAS